MEHMNLMSSKYCLSNDIRNESDYEKLRDLDEMYGFRQESYDEECADIGVSMISI